MSSELMGGGPQPFVLADQSPKRRKRLLMRVRTLFGLSYCVASLLAVPLHGDEPTSAAAAVVATVERLQGKVIYDAADPGRITGIDLSDRQTTNADLAC